ncbi:MarC family protein [Altererythrobacter sp.]|uniref:MarC family protein n=1 Tax=Altererythrobacter sp. TaxID=1872480 RepID=UPI003CFEB982
MDDFTFVFTIFFSLMGPVKLIVYFASETEGYDESFKRAVALRSTLISGATVTAVALCAPLLLYEYQVSIEALMLAGGVVLLLTALNGLIGKKPPQPAKPSEISALDFSFAHVATKLIVTPPTIASILIFMMLASEYPHMPFNVAGALALIVPMNLAVMYYNSQILRLPSLLLILKIVASVLIFMQVALAIDTILVALARLDLVPEVTLV